VVNQLNITTQVDYINIPKDTKRELHLPASVHDVYNLSSNEMFRKSKHGHQSYISYGNARLWCIKNDIRTQADYYDRYNEHDKLPSNPNREYKKSGEWKGWKHYLGKTI